MSPSPSLPHGSGRSWITWSSLGLGVHGLGQFALLAVLARHLTKEEFGLVAAAMVVVAFCRVAQSSIGPALVHRPNLHDGHVRAAFALAVWTAAVVVVLLWLAAPACGHFFRDEGLAPLLRAMSLLFVLHAAGVVPEALLQRELRLRDLAHAEIAGVLLGYLPLGVGLAVQGCGAWSLVGAHLGQAAAKSAVLLRRRPHPIRLLARGAETRELARYAFGAMLAGFCTQGASQGDYLVVGRWLSPMHLGVYSRAYQLMVMPAMFLGEVTDRIVFPLLARVQEDKDQLRFAYARGVALVVAVMAPAAAAGIVLGPELIRVILGPGWHDVVLPFQVLMAGLVFRTGYKLSDTLARAMGAVYERAWRQALFAVGIFVGSLAGVAFGTVGVAIGVVMALLGNYALMAWLSCATTGLPAGAFVRLHLRGALLALVVGGVVWGVAAPLRAAAAPALVVLLGGLAAAGLALLVLLRACSARVLGGDGIWLWRTLTGRSAA